MNAITTVKRLYKVLAMVVGINICFIIVILCLSIDERLFCNYVSVIERTFKLKNHYFNKDAKLMRRLYSDVDIPEYYAAIFIRRGNYNGVELYSDYYACSGIIIAYHWIVTTGRCVYYLHQHNIPLRNVYVETKVSDLQDGFIIHTIRYYSLPEEFLDFYKMDVGLIRVHGPPLLNNIVIKPPLPLAQTLYNYEDKSECLIQGISKNLRTYERITLYIISNSECMNSSALHRGLQEYRFCVRYPLGKDSCMFPIGTPVIQNKILIGLNIENECSGVRDTGIFMKVSYFEEWIKNYCQDKCWTVPNLQ